MYGLGCKGKGGSGCSQTDQPVLLAKKGVRCQGVFMIGLEGTFFATIESRALSRVFGVSILSDLASRKNGDILSYGMAALRSSGMRGRSECIHRLRDAV